MKAIESIYNFVISFQMFMLFLFLVYFISEDLFISYPIEIVLTNEFQFSFDLQISVVSLSLFLVISTILYIISSITVVGSGLSDTGTNSIKEIVSFTVKYAILIIPTNFIFSLSEILNVYVIYVDLIILIIYVAKKLTTDEGGD